MNWSARLAWLATLRPLRRRRSAEIDHGDMGTAFGLDASLQTLGPTDELDDSPPPAPTHWESRLIRRSGL